MSTSSKVRGRSRVLSLAMLLSVGLVQACSSSGGSGGKGSGSGGSGGDGLGGSAVSGGGTSASGGGISASGSTSGTVSFNGGNSSATGGVASGGGGVASGTGGVASGAGGVASGTGGSSAIPCADTQPPGGTDCATWKTWGQCGSQWFRDSRLCDITCGVCGSGASSTGGNAGTGNAGGTSAGSGGVSTGSTGNPASGGSGSSSTGGTGGTTVPKTATPFVPPADAKPTPETSGKSGAFRVNAQGHLTHNGTEFQVRGGNWFGLEGQDDIARPGAMELYIGAVYWADTANKRTIEQTMKEIVASPLTLNTIRLPVAPQTLVANHPDGLYSRTDVKIRNNDPAYYPYTDALSALEDFLVQASKNNLYVILDMHSCSNHIGWRAGKIDDGPPWTDANRENYKYKKEDYTCKTGEDAYDVTKWLADIHTLAKLPKKLGIKNIIGIDCFNEPFKYSWSDWADLSQQCYDAIAAEDDDLIAVVEGVSGSHVDASGNTVDEPYGDVTTNPNWGENLYGQQFDPI
ncbi:MAG TPA: cellulase family glycosylhydrolase, partial [Polyangia bacterium]